MAISPRIVSPLLLVGCMAFVGSAFLYPPLDRTMVSLLAVALFVVLVGVRYQQPDDTLTALAVLTALLPWLIAAATFANGALDRSDERSHPTVVIGTRYSYRSGFRDTLVVRSWRPGRATESLSVSAYQLFYPGDRVTVAVRAGALGLPWVTRISR